MKAIDTFRKPPYMHNCAQAVAFRWRSLFADDPVVRFADSNRGQAPEGLCGALYVAMQACPEHAREICADFKARCHGTGCIELKTVAQTPCTVCVETADILVDKYSGQE